MTKHYLAVVLHAHLSIRQAGPAGELADRQNRQQGGREGLMAWGHGHADASMVNCNQPMKCAAKSNNFRVHFQPLSLSVDTLLMKQSQGCVRRVLMGSAGLMSARKSYTAC